MMTTASVYPRVEEERYLALLRAANAIATCNDCRDASDTLVSKLREVTPFDYLHLVAFDKDSDAACWSMLETNGGGRLDAPSFEESPMRYVHESAQPL